ncbi:MAG TPA: hypothetical protein VGF61_06870 [Candidatus Acidoferrum sp.]
MRNRAVYALVAGMLLLAGCGKSNNNSMQNATPQQAPAPSNQTATPQQSAAQTPTQEQAQAANPANAQPEAPAPPPEPPPPLVVPAGTTVPVILATSISSYKNKAGEEFEGNLAAPIVVNGEVAVPKGAKLRGTIVDAKKQGKFKGEALLTIRLTSVDVRGKEYLISTHTWSDTEKGKGKRTAVVTGGGAGGGALIGGLAGGGKGAGIGAAIGAIGGLAASGGTGGKNVNLPAETKINFKLAKSLTIER